MTADPLPAKRRPSPAELAAAVLSRTWPDPHPRYPVWRGRAVDEAMVLIELCRWLEGCHRHDGPAPAAPTALAGLFAELARRRAPLAAVRRLVRRVVAHAHRELDTGGTARDTDTDTDTVLAVLERAYRPVRNLRNAVENDVVVINSPI